MSIHPDFISAGLEDRYNLILNTRMIGVPVVNPELRVESVGFQPWGECCVGVLITPWFMNLTLVAGEGSDWNDLKVGTTHVHHFPSGRYEFVVGYEEGIGFYQSCSLFSPMFEFSSHEDALLVAQETMNVIMDEKHRDTSCSTHNQEILDIWDGKANAPDPGEQGLFDHSDKASANPADEDSPSLGERMAQPMSRREMLRGSFLRGDEK